MRLSESYRRFGGRRANLSAWPRVVPLGVAAARWIGQKAAPERDGRRATQVMQQRGHCGGGQVRVSTDGRVARGVLAPTAGLGWTAVQFA